MKPFMGSSPRTSLRLSASIEDVCRRRSQRSKVKPYLNVLNVEKNSKCKFPLLKLVLLVIVTVTFVSLIYSPDIIHHNHPSHSVSQWIWGGSDPRYASDLNVDWGDVSKILKKQNLAKNEYQGIGLLNFNATETERFKSLTPKANHIGLQLEYAEKNVTWDSLYPEWIDEEEEEDVPICPTLPRLKAPGKRLDLIAVKLPCRKGYANWSRDVARLHLQLAAAGLAASSNSDNDLLLLFVSECFPIPNLFSCNELVSREGDVWLYNPNLNVLKEKVQLPVGSCELSLPLRGKEVMYSGNVNKQAYATILHSADVYVCGAIAVAQSIRMSGSSRDLVILVDDTISGYHRSGLEAAGWKIKTIDRIRNPRAEKDAYNEWNYSKFRLWQLTDYDKIIFVDSDLLVLRNIDFLFTMSQVSATGNNGTLFNSGVMVIEPSNCTFKLLMSRIDEIESYNGGDQGYLNEIFTWWHRIPKHTNFLKNFWVGDDERVREKKTSLFGSDPPKLYVLHYLGLKPWMCFRDYDCNWNVEVMREFASDVAHDRWWRVHDAMPVGLRRFCLIPSKQKAQLEWDRRQAEIGNFSDCHWRARVKDQRLRICVDDLCNWKDMLKHWGETNWTDGSVGFYSPTSLSVLSAGLS